MLTIYPHGFGFLQPLCECDGVEFVADPAAAQFVLCMNNAGLEGVAVIEEARRIADRAGIPLCWATIEDPNSFGSHAYQHQASLADYVFTSDRECIAGYQRLGPQQVYWLPLAASERLHRPLPLAEGAAEFVFSGNFYPYGARKWGDETVLLPLARAGYSFAIFSYEQPPYPELARFWRGGCSCYTVAEQYRHGRVVLGNNNQRSGMDGIQRTVMTSMRTFEALACGKPFLAPHSDAYEALGFTNHTDMEWAWDANGALESARMLLEFPETTANLALERRRFLLQRHTYRHRLERIARAIAGQADPMDWR
jgi:spore maturation protein CgeB